MKFAKELEDDLVPEWRAKYINYKQGKKKIKAISKALRNVNKTPKIGGRPELSHVSSSASIPYTHYDFNSKLRTTNTNGDAANGSPANAVPPSARQQYAAMRKMSATMFSTSPPTANPDSQPPSSSDDDDDADNDSEDSIEEHTPLKKTVSGPASQQSTKSYGSFSPPGKSRPETSQHTDKEEGKKMPSLALPDPALDPGRERTQAPESQTLQQERSQSERHKVPQLKDGERPDPRKTNSQPLMRQMAQRLLEQQRNQAKTSNSQSPKVSARDRFKRLFQARDINAPEVSNAQQDAYQELDVKQDDFFRFLDKELQKVEKFYKTKEDEAQDRLDQLRAQLHEHRDQRARDMKMERQGHLRRQDDTISQYLAETPFPSMPKKEFHQKTQNGTFLHKVFHHNEPNIGKTSKAMDKLASPPTSPQTKATNDARDYTKKRPTAGNENVPHKFAKRRLKLALQEFYRGMELLKSYALLNRTGFRKINKKYDKAVNARPPLRYLNEKVSNAHFVKSTLIDEYLVAVEDLYARYFERGNRKVAVKKLRSKLQEGDHSGTTFRNGLFLAAGAGFGFTGLYNAVDLLFSENPETSLVTAYLMQMYGGYFLGLLLFLSFTLNCKVWKAARINYVFVFEYDTRHVLDWRQLAEIPCFFLFLNGLFVWLNFKFGEDAVMYRYWPVILYGLTVVIMALPFRVLYYHARQWWGFSNFRLLFAGLYPVEFRDFFLGDMYCSETYLMSQIEIFFCVYRFNWNNPTQCNSNHSMLLGFFTCLPAIWRFLQCIRRYVDSGNWFPHLANCAKYTCNILYYMSFSLYRLHVNSAVRDRYKIAFLFFAALNALYCSLWDVAMDWSLGNLHAKHRGLRDQLGYRRPWIYYAAMVFNTVLRHQWILYAIFTEDLQHSAAMSFFVGLAEVIRRGVWTSFRVENEHTSNVASFRASRDIPLPYSLEHSPQVAAKDQDKKSESRRRRKDAASHDDDDSRASTTGADHDLERQTTEDSNASSNIRRRMSTVQGLGLLQRVGTLIAAAHTEDFQKKRRPEVVGDSPDDETMLHEHGDSSDDDDPSHEIDGSVIGNNDTDHEGGHDEEETRKLARDDAPKRGHGYARGSESPGSDFVEEASSSGDSGDADERDMQGDVDQAKALAQKYNAGAGLRGSSKKKNGESSGSGKKKQ